MVLLNLWSVWAQQHWLNVSWKSGNCFKTVIVSQCILMMLVAQKLQNCTIQGSGYGRRGCFKHKWRQKHVHSGFTVSVVKTEWECCLCPVHIMLSPKYTQVFIFIIIIIFAYSSICGQCALSFIIIITLQSKQLLKKGYIEIIYKYFMFTWMPCDH